MASAEAAVPVDVAASLIAEASLLLDRLEGRLSNVRGVLDRAARQGRVTRALSSSSADYLRALSCRSWRRQVAELDLPERIATRLGPQPDRALARLELLEEAIGWETAAVLCERTMSEWGSGVVLGGLR